MAHDTISLPPPIASLVDALGAQSDVVAVALGGSRALGTSDRTSDWDLGVYYRGGIDLSLLSAFGPVHAPGQWGRLMNGGAWLQLEGLAVDVMLRDLTVVEHWTKRAIDGEFERDALLGYLAGAPTYLLAAELASCRVLVGALPSTSFPERLRAAAPHVWRFCRDFSLEYAEQLEARGDRIAALGHASAAALQEAHAVLCERGEWICNEKRLLERAGLTWLAESLDLASATTEPVKHWVASLRERFGDSTAH